MYIRPQSIKLDKKRHVLVVDWNDGNSVEYRWNGIGVSVIGASSAVVDVRSGVITNNTGVTVGC